MSQLAKPPLAGCGVALVMACGSMASMSEDYRQLLDATIRHLEELKERGTRFVPVSPDTLKALAGPRRAAGAKASAAQVVAQPAPMQTAAAPSRSAAPAPKRVEPIPAREVSLPLDLPGAPASAAAAPAPALSPEAKAAAFAELRRRALACVKCSHLAASRTNVVFGVGDINAPLMFVGEAPGEDEDKQGEPFVGKAGQLLTKIIQTMGLARETVYIGNILKCRPDTPGQTSGNRKPTSEEMLTCIPYLHEQIDLIKPRVLVALGGTAIEGLLGKTLGITKLRGQWKTYRGIPLMTTYHPA